MSTRAVDPRKSQLEILRVTFLFSSRPTYNRAQEPPILLKTLIKATGTMPSIQSSPVKPVKPVKPIKRRRTPRIPYTEEQYDFIWFHRDDLGMRWKQIKEFYNDYFGEKRSLVALEACYSRIAEFPNIVRVGKRPRPECGLLEVTMRRYAWMGAETSDGNTDGGYGNSGDEESEGEPLKKKARVG